MYWFPEVCLTRSKSRATDSCSWTNQVSVLGGWTIESLEAISCQDRRLLQSAGAKSRKRLVFSLLWSGLSVKWWLMFFWVFLQHTLQPLKHKCMDRLTDRLVDWQKLDRQTQTNGKIETSVSRAGKERQGQIAMERGKKLSRIVSSGIFLQWRYWWTDSMFKNPVAPWDFPNHCCWGPQNINFI